MRLHLWRRSNLRLAVIFASALGVAALAQDSTSYLTPTVARIGDRLACRCGGCRNTVGNCPMMHCSSADPKRKRIYELKQAGLTDDNVIQTFVQEEGAIALSAPPIGSVGGLVTWAMPGIALLGGFWIWLRFVRGNRGEAKPISVEEQAAMERYREQLDGEFDEAPGKR